MTKTKELQPNGTWKRSPLVSSRPTSTEKNIIRKQLKMRKCAYCYSKEDLTIDHKNPISKGGNNKMSNLQVLCKKCNGMKSSYTDGELKRIFKWHSQIQKKRGLTKIINGVLLILGIE